MLRQLFAHNSTQDWALALFAAIASMVVLHTLRRMVLLRLERMAKTTETWIDDFFVDVLSATRILLTSAIGLYVAAHFLALPPPWRHSWAGPSSV